jgi:septal ring factor EnvC (AmiA/AmiB activator)
MRAAEEPLKTGLDVKGLRAQVMGRIEELEDRERQREDLLAQVLAVAEEQGLDAGALEAVLGG